MREALAPLDHADVELAVEDVFALVDGLVLHAVLQPARSSAGTMRRVVRAHLERLCDDTK